MPKGRRKGVLEGLAQREEQTLNLLYKHGPSTAKEIQTHIGDDLNNATVRTILRNLEAKGYVKHKVRNTSFIYSPTTEKKTAAKNIFNTLIDTFFSGSLSDAVVTFVENEDQELDPKELDELLQLIKKLKTQWLGHRLSLLVVQCLFYTNLIFPCQSHSKLLLKL